ncbi:hypothetical protein E3P99_02240 [Wallemia hederae]|uniref:Glucose-methanol-choline oxidoreductase N-terminal domain-containing protein n=1 Tax=Wallemia hederae TaxID=1540922 RepID=A0A4T0FKN8_9BASI|nr:hypothetical protein E3P99_02240 [Wallemia hederae]
MITKRCTVLIALAAAANAANPDYIVVGGGTTGLALATRLSDTSDVNVLVLEAGQRCVNADLRHFSNSLAAVSIKAQLIYLLADLRLAHNVGASFYVYFAKGVQSIGTTRLGWDRPHSREIDAWGRLGNEGWSFEDLLTYMKRSEHVHIPSEDVLAQFGIDDATKLETDTIGHEGQLQATITQNVPDFATKWLPAFEEIGIDANYAPWDGDNSGPSINPSSVNYRNFTRSYSASAYYFPLAYRENLQVETGVQVTRLAVSGDKVVGVEYIKDGETITASADKEVILSAGAIGTPQILELSGIGRRDVLEQSGIDVVLELDGVGENFQDHTAVSTNWKLKEGFDSNDRLKFDKEYLSKELQKFQDGDFTSAVAYVGACLAYVSLDNIFDEDGKALYLRSVEEYVESQSDSPYAKLYEEQMKFIETNAIEHLVANSFVSYSDERKAEANTSYISVEAAVQHPVSLFQLGRDTTNATKLSRGSIHIQSSDPAEHPKLSANYFGVESDAVLQTQDVRKLMHSAAMQEIAAEEVYPGSNVTSDEDLMEYWKTAIRSEHHLIGTASMLPKEMNGVVDSDLKVYGLSNLRIADASIMPLHVSAHIQATLYGIAEKVSCCRLCYLNSSNILRLLT